MRTIKVTGRGHLKAKPDITRITITLENTDRDYDNTLRKSAKDTEELKKLIAGTGMETSSIKTLHFNIDTKYESYRENDEYKRRFVGYEYKHRMKVEFENDNDILGRVLYALGHSKLSPEFRISYAVKNPESARNSLLKKAVEDAKEKAEILAGAACVALKDILTVDYSWGEIDITYESVKLAKSISVAEDSTDAYNLDIEPDDIDIEDTVTVIWEIE